MQAKKKRAKNTVACPSCGTEVRAKADTFPFCDARCRTIDLGRWLDGDYRFDAQEISPSEHDLNSN